MAAGLRGRDRPAGEGDRPRDRRVLRDALDPFQVINADESTSGMVTGYYEPLLRGSRTRTPHYRHALYGVPQDLLVIDLTSVYPDLKHKRLRGRIEGNRVVPYLARGDIAARTRHHCAAGHGLGR